MSEPLLQHPTAPTRGFAKAVRPLIPQSAAPPAVSERHVMREAQEVSNGNQSSLFWVGGGQHPSGEYVDLGSLPKATSLPLSDLYATPMSVLLPPAQPQPLPRPPVPPLQPPPLLPPGSSPSAPPESSESLPAGIGSLVLALATNALDTTPVSYLTAALVAIFNASEVQLVQKDLLVIGMESQRDLTRAVSDNLRLGSCIARKRCSVESTPAHQQPEGNGSLTQSYIITQHLNTSVSSSLFPLPAAANLLSENGVESVSSSSVVEVTLASARCGFC